VGRHNSEGDGEAASNDRIANWQRDRTVARSAIFMCPQSPPRTSAPEGLKEFGGVGGLKGRLMAADP
jgi:hypothetical protein